MKYYSHYMKEIQKLYTEVGKAVEVHNAEVKNKRRPRKAKAGREDGAAAAGDSAARVRVRLGVQCDSEARVAHK